MEEYLKCPKCGKTFKAPSKDRSLWGPVLTEPGKGLLSCPACGFFARHKRFPVSDQVTDDSNAPTDNTSDQTNDI